MNAKYESFWCRIDLEWFEISDSNSFRANQNYSVIQKSISEPFSIISNQSEKRFESYSTQISWNSFRINLIQFEWTRNKFLICINTNSDWSKMNPQYESFWSRIDLEWFEISDSNSLRSNQNYSVIPKSDSIWINPK